MEIYLSPLAEKKLDHLLTYLETEWGYSTKEKFLKRLEKEFELLSSQPYRCQRTQSFSDLFNCIITKQTSAIYRVIEDRREIEIITIFDNRQDPKKLKGEIKKHLD